MNCIICSNKDYCNDYLQNDPTLLEKLQFCIPEVGWSIAEQFCSTCEFQVNTFYSFKKLCIQSYYNYRQKAEQKHYLIKSPVRIEESSKFNSLSYESPNNSPCYESSDFAEESGNSSNNKGAFNLVTCFICESKFETKEILEKHSKCQHLERAGENEVNEKSAENSVILENNCMKNNQKCYVKDDISGNEDMKTNNKEGSLKVKIAVGVKEEKSAKKGRKPVRSYSCEICGQFFNFARNVVNHAIKEHNMDQKSVKPYSCDICETRFSCCANLLQHKKYHEKTRSVICAFCGKAFITKSDLTVHEHTHYNKRNYKCEKCDKAFNTNKTLRSHNLVCHTNPSLWKYCCSICGRRFPLKSGYDQHMKRHLGDKKHACHFCEKSFVSASELKKHLVFHSNVRAFKCHLCEKEYKEKKIYEIHLAKVHNIGDVKIPVRVKKFTCHVCGNLFADRPKLDRHMCTHTGLKPYPCDLCVKKFTDKSYLKHHRKVVHGVDSTIVPG